MARLRRIELSAYDDQSGFPANSSALYLQRKLRERERPGNCTFQKQGTAILSLIMRIERRILELKKICAEGSLYGSSTEHIQELIVGIKDEMGEVQMSFDQQPHRGYINQQSRKVAEKGQQQLYSRFVRATVVFKTVLEHRQARMKNFDKGLGSSGNFQIKKKFASFMRPKKVLDIPTGEGADESTTAIMMEELEEQQADQDQESLLNIERTLMELNSIFQRMSTIVEEHQTLIERIDMNTEAALDHAEKGKKELTQAYKTLADCRRLMLKKKKFDSADYFKKKSLEQLASQK